MMEEKKEINKLWFEKELLIEEVEKYKKNLFLFSKKFNEK